MQRVSWISVKVIFFKEFEQLIVWIFRWFFQSADLICVTYETRPQSERTQSKNQFIFNKSTELSNTIFPRGSHLDRFERGKFNFFCILVKKRSFHLFPPSFTAFFTSFSENFFPVHKLLRRIYKMIIRIRIRTIRWLIDNVPRGLINVGGGVGAVVMRLNTKRDRNLE